MARMTWYPTRYKSGDATYGGFVLASSRSQAWSLCKMRGIGERLETMAHPEMSRGKVLRIIYPNGTKRRPYAPVSQMLRRRNRTTKEQARVFHAASFLGMLALKSRVATPDRVLGDQGFLHEIAHWFEFARDEPRGRFKTLFRGELIASIERIERAVPGYGGSL